MLSVIHLLQILINMIVQENVLQNQSILGKALWLKKRRLSVTREMTDNDNKLPRTRSRTEQYDKSMRIICQQPDGPTCKVAFKETGKTVLSVGQKLSGTFFIRLNTTTYDTDAITKDFLHHNLCRAKAKRLAEPQPKRWQMLN